MLRKTFENGSSVDMAFLKRQLPKMVQLEGFHPFTSSLLDSLIRH